MAEVKVWVIMGNDFPSCVFSTKKAAEDFVARKKEQQKRMKAGDRGAHINWRAYEFEVWQ